LAQWPSSPTLGDEKNPIPLRIDPGEENLRHWNIGATSLDEHDGLALFFDTLTPRVHDFPLHHEFFSSNLIPSATGQLIDNLHSSSVALRMMKVFPSSCQLADMLEGAAVSYCSHAIDDPTLKHCSLSLRTDSPISGCIYCVLVKITSNFYRTVNQALTRPFSRLSTRQRIAQKAITIRILRESGSKKLRIVGEPGGVKKQLVRC
jgi:hypothetical protein